MLNALTNRLGRLEAALVGRECSCPPPEPVPLRPGFREVARREVPLGVLPCPDCGGRREVTVVETILESS